MSLQLIATAAFGLEAVVMRELADLGYQAAVMRPGRIAFVGDARAVCRCNLWLRSADRVQIELARFESADFDTLFETVRELPWEAWIEPDAAIPVTGRSHKSQLTSVPACQRTVKKAIVERLGKACGGVDLTETTAAVPVDVALFENMASITIDTSGRGLHRRGYRTLVGEAQLRETLAAALVQLSFWKPGRPFLDPFCGTGTIAIEAALWGRRLAPGRNREFASEHWPAIPDDLWKIAREEAADQALESLPERIVATDADPEALKLARFHAEQAGVIDDIHFQQRDFAELRSQRQYGCLITNPPYGVRLGEDAEIAALYESMPAVLRHLDTWSHFILSARLDLERLVGQTANKRRKLYNGRIECTYFQFFGPRPPKEATPEETTPRETTEETKPDRMAAAPPRAFGGLRPEAQRQAEEFANRLRKRARHLRRWPTKRGITCFRLYERDVPDVPLVVDRYEDALHIAEFERPHDRTAAEHADWLDLMTKIAGEVLEVPQELVFVKHRDRQRGNSQYGRVANENAVRVVQEGGLRFEVNLSDYVDTGLFLDHRLTRTMVREAAGRTRFLNLFAYTGAFTVYAAAGGATHTTSVDLSATYLEWIDKNLTLNNFGLASRRLVRSDVWDFLESLSPNEQFDLAVVDPPTFSNSKQLAYDWDIQCDHARLLNRVIAHMSPGGVIFFSTNSRRFKLDESALTGVTIRDITRQTIPEDFRNQRIHKCWKIEKQ